MSSDLASFFVARGLTRLCLVLCRAGDEAVSVNQRALIDKVSCSRLSGPSWRVHAQGALLLGTQVLARYSGENTIFRELLQNADDSSSSLVEISFRTSSASNRTLPDLATAQCQSVTVRNDGSPFSADDWARLKKIADGNPNELRARALASGRTV